MELEQQLKTAILSLHDHRFGDEEAIKQYIIEPVLRTLGWDVSDQRRLVEREYPTGSGRVDYALLEREQPLAFIEAKQIGSADDPESRQQLFRYGANKGIPILVLTDGRLWEFYSGKGFGDWHERCFRRLALDDDQDLSEYAKFLMEHLGRDAVVQGKAESSAGLILRTKWAMPTAWRTLLKEPDSQLHELLTSRVESECGVRPRVDVVRAFLKEQANAAQKESPQGLSSSPPSTPRSDARSHSASRAESEASTSEAASPHQPPSEPPKWIPQTEFALPILRVLVEMGGRGETKPVLAKIEEAMASRFGDGDRERLDKGGIRWKKNAQFGADILKRKGLLKQTADSGKGWWEVSEQGRAYEREHR